MLEQRLGIVYRDRRLLHEAMTLEGPHEALRGTPDNERLEFLGDAVLGMVVAEYLYRLFPGEKEGPLTRRRMAVVSGETLDHLARQLGLQSLLKALHAPRILRQDADRGSVVEALIGALYLDQGMEACRELIERLLLSRMDELFERRRDFKSEVNNLLQELAGNPPTFDTQFNRRTHDGQEFISKLSVRNVLIAEGIGATKREAEYAASKAALGTRSEWEPKLAPGTRSAFATIGEALKKSR